MVNQPFGTRTLHSQLPMMKNNLCPNGTPVAGVVFILDRMRWQQHKLIYLLSTNVNKYTFFCVKIKDKEAPMFQFESEDV